MKYNGIEITPEWDDNIPYCGVSKCSAFGKMGCSHGLVWSEGKRCDSAIRSMRRENEDLRTAQKIDKMRGELLQEIDDALLQFWVGGRLDTIEQIMEDVKRLRSVIDDIRDRIRIASRFAEEDACYLHKCPISDFLEKAEKKIGR